MPGSCQAPATRRRPPGRVSENTCLLSSFCCSFLGAGGIHRRSPLMFMFFFSVRDVSFIRRHISPERSGWPSFVALAATDVLQEMWAQVWNKHEANRPEVLGRPNTAEVRSHP